jgi:hypothetical protein
MHRICEDTQALKHTRRKRNDDDSTFWSILLGDLVDYRIVLVNLTSVEGTETMG